MRFWKLSPSQYDREDAVRLIHGYLEYQMWRSDGDDGEAVEEELEDG